MNLRFLWIIILWSTIYNSHKILKKKRFWNSLDGCRFCRVPWSSLVYEIEWHELCPEYHGVPKPHVDGLAWPSQRYFSVSLPLICLSTLTTGFRIHSPISNTPPLLMFPQYCWDNLAFSRKILEKSQGKSKRWSGERQ